VTLQEFLDGLTALGFTKGYAIGGDPAEITLWENETKQPTNAAIAKAAPQGANLRECEAITALRLTAYQNESDPIYMEAQRDPSRTIAEWEAKIQEIKARYPYPEKQSDAAASTAKP
jgi:hypothetical protein